MVDLLFIGLLDTVYNYPKGRSYEFPGAEAQAIHLAGVGFATEIASYWDNKLLR